MGRVRTGITPYNDPLTLAPLFVDLNFRFLEANASPYLYLKAGYNFSVYRDDDIQINDHRGGLLINAGYNIDNFYYEFETWGLEL